MVNRDSETKRLIVILLFLVIVIIALGTAIIIKQIQINDPEKTQINCADRSTLFEIELCIESEYKDNNDIQEVIQEYRYQIDKSKSISDFELATNLIESRISFLAVNHFCDLTFELLDIENLDGFDNQLLQRVYNQAIGSSITCENDDMSSKYQGLFDSIQSRGTEYEQ